MADVPLDWQRREDEMHAFFRPDGLPLICFPTREQRWRLREVFAVPESARGPRPSCLTWPAAAGSQ